MTRIRRLIAIFVLLAALCTLCGCAAGEYNMIVDGFPQTLDPQVEAGKAGGPVLSFLFRCLLRCDADGNLTTDAAEQYFFSDDGLKLTFVIANGQLWSDGSEVTSHDFAYAVRRILAPETASPYAELLYSINGARAFHESADDGVAGVSCPDDRTLVLTLDYTDEMLLYTFGSICLAPCNEEFFLSTQGSYGMTSAKTMFNGEYGVYSRGSSSVVLQLREGADKSNPSKITFKKASAYSSGELQKQLKSGRIDSALTTVKLSDDSGVSSSEQENSTWLVCFSATRATVSNQLFSFALSRGGIGELQTQTGVTNVMPRLYADLFLQTSNPVRISDNAAAKEFVGKLLQGEKLSAMPEITMLVPDEAEARRLSDTLVSLWQKNAGVFVNREYYSRSKISSLVAADNYDMALLPVTYNSATPAAF